VTEANPIPGFSYWEPHPDHPVADWRYQVSNDDTRQSYWDWVRQRILDEAER
jgi:hypothetical protein